MTDELAGLITHFGGDLTRTRCLLHVINLVAKSVTKEFNVQDSGEEGTDSELTTLADGIMAEELQTIKNWEGCGDESDDVDDVDGWVDEISLLTANERARLEGKIRPVKLALVKVSEIKMNRLTCSLVYSILDPKNCVQDYPLYHNPPSSLESGFERTRAA